jgi:hypothetical protein
MERKVGVPDDPFGERKARFADCEAKVTVKVPEVVTGDPLTVKIPGIDSDTEETLAFPFAVNSWL